MNNLSQANIDSTLAQRLESGGSIWFPRSPKPQRKNGKTRFCTRHCTVERSLIATCETDADKKAHREVMHDAVAAALKIKDFERRCPSKGAGRERASYDHCLFAQRWHAR